jgi:serine protease Do
MQTNEENEEKENFSFINEKRKEKPVNKRRLLSYAVFTVAMAILFGLIASFVFVIAKPEFENMINPPEEPVVTIPKDEISDTQETEQMPDTAQEETESQEPEISEDTRQEETESQEPEIVYVPQELEPSDFQQLQNKIYEIGREANRFVVTVTGVKSDTDWFNNAYESRGQASGILIADNGQELLVLTEHKVISDAQEIYVTFINDTSVKAEIKKYDGETGITVLSVPLNEVDSETMEAISIAELGNSLLTPQGTIAVAVGSPLGTNYSILIGNITSTTNVISTTDANYTVFTTDIIGSKDGSGVLINLQGQVIGLVMQDYSSSGDENTLTAISISELKAVIEMLSNGKDIPYIGLELTTVTNEIAQEYDIPKGAYITNVKMDSPGMAAGLQKGDVITAVDGDTINSVDGYERKLLSQTPGQDVEIVVQRQSGDGYTEITCIVNVSVL